MNIFIIKLFNAPEFYSGLALLVVFSICCHEFMHAWVALKFGDPTAADRGHLTLNPLKQMGVMSIIMFMILGIAWGSVPVNRANFRSKYADLVVSMAGPLTNLFLAVIFAIGLAVAVYFKQTDESLVFQWTLYASIFNVVLFILNSLPVPGFDGWCFVNAILPKLRNGNTELLGGASFVIIMLVLIGFRYLYAIGAVFAGLVAQLALNIIIYFAG